jgi:hypothetical protein
MQDVVNTSSLCTPFFTGTCNLVELGNAGKSRTIAPQENDTLSKNLPTVPRHISVLLKAVQP